MGAGRHIGQIVAARGQPERAHICWPYIERREFFSAARDFFLDGIRAGWRLCYVGPGTPDDLRREMANAACMEQLVEHGHVVLCPGHDLAGGDDPIAPYKQLAAYDRATRRALDDGYRGLRVVIDVSSLVTAAPQRAVLLRWEAAADAYVSANPFSVLCGYDVTRVGAVEELAAVHALAREGSTTFQLATSGDGAMALAGELDPSNVEAFGRVLEHLELDTLGDVSDEVILDASALAFIDHHALRALDRYGDERAVAFVLRGARATVRRLIEILELPNVRAC